MIDLNVHCFLMNLLIKWNTLKSQDRSTKLVKMNHFLKNRNLIEHEFRHIFCFNFSLKYSPKRPRIQLPIPGKSFIFFPPFRRFNSILNRLIPGSRLATMRPRIMDGPRVNMRSNYLMDGFKLCAIMRIVRDSTLK